MISDVILHLFDWRFRDIIREIPSIVADGFGTIQISPPQLSADTEEWWGRYQPVDHTQIGGPLGSEQELRALIQKAHDCNPSLQVIVDVVFNHMAQSCSERKMLKYPRFGPEHFHEQANIDWDSIESIRTGWIGYGPDLPDLRTENSYVRAELKNYIDLLLNYGADGFRFDAVKHIEPDFFDIVLADLPSEMLRYGEYVLQKGHESIMQAYLPNMKLMDFKLLETMAKAFEPGGDLRILVDAGSQGYALPAYQGIAFVTNHDLELGEYGGFGLPEDSLELGHVYTITRLESIPLVWKDHRHLPIVRASMKLRELARVGGYDIVHKSERVLAWKFGNQGALIINTSEKTINLSTADLGFGDVSATNMLSGLSVGRDVAVPPRKPILLWL